MWRRVICNKKAQALVIAIFVMLALSLISWTVVNFTTADLEMGTRVLDSDRALYLAESGATWASGQCTTNSTWCSGGYLSAALPHNLGAGQYDVTCSNANGATVITATGYVPSKTACTSALPTCRAKKVVNLVLGSGPPYISTLIYAYNDFNWSGAILTPALRSSRFDGDVAVGNIAAGSPHGFNGDGDAIPNEANVDYRNDSNPANILPPCSATVSPLPQRIAQTSYPGVSMDTLRTTASDYWPDPGNNPTPDDLAAAMDQNLRLCFATFNLGNMWGVNNDLGQSFGVAGGGTYTVNNVKVLHGPNYFAPSGTVRLRLETNAAAGAARPSGTLVAGFAEQTYPPTPSGWNMINFPAITLNSGVTYWLVLIDSATQNPENRYSVRAGYYNSANGLVLRVPPAGAWDTADRQTDPQLCFRICQDAVVRTGVDGSRIYNRSLPYILGDLGGTEYDCAQQFMIRPWWPSSTVTNVITRHRAPTGAPGGAITVRIETDNNGLPSGTLAAPTATTTYTAPGAAGYTATFPSPVALQYDTKYWIVWDAANQANNVYYNLAAAGYKYGAVSYRSNGVWQTARQPDMFFNITLQTGETPGGANSNDSSFFTGMTNEILKNYSLNRDWSSDEWAVVNSVYAINYADIAFYGQGADGKFAVTLDRSVDWLDTQEVQLSHRVTGGNNSNERWYVASGLVFDASAGGISFDKKSYTAERDIGLVGSNAITLTALSTPQKANRQPLLISEFGDIYSTSPKVNPGDPEDYTLAAKRTLAGLLYTQAGNVTLNYLCSMDTANAPAGSGCGGSDMGMAILGSNINMTGYIYMDNTSTRIDRDGNYLVGNSASGTSWQEQ